MKNIDINFFPGWTRKAMTFTIDDGWVAMDTNFINIVRPYGIKGSFNISSDNVTKYNNPKLIRATYRGFEITNHVKLHPFAFRDGEDVRLSEEPLDEKTAEGIKKIIEKYNETLKGLEVEEINPVGEVFDPNIAEAVMQAPADDGQEPDTVKQVFQKGYKLKDKIIRYAKVCVVK